MALKDTKFWIWWKTYGEHLTAPMILIFIMVSCFMLYQDMQLKKEISTNCGWGDDDYQCFCEYGDAMEIKNKIDEIITNEVKFNVSMVS